MAGYLHLAHALVGAIFLGGLVVRAAHVYELAAVTLVFGLMIAKPF